jgi:CTP synthase (UTP-ammonia lyase)
MGDAEHEESSPQASNLLISKLSCSLVGQRQEIKIQPGSLAHRIYRKGEVTEDFLCNYGLNPHYADQIGSEEFKISGRDREGEIRIVEMPGNRFFLATLFLPQFNSSPERPHPLLLAYLKAAVDFNKEIRKEQVVEAGQL